MLPYIETSINQLINAGADFIVLPCNTLHSLLPKLREKFNVEFMDLIEQVSRNINEDYKIIAILSTSKTREEKLYDKNLPNTNIIYPTESEQKIVSEIIVRIIRKESNEQDKTYLKNLILSLKQRGAEKIVLACTDLFNLVSENEYVLDSTDVLIGAVKEKMLD